MGKPKPIDVREERCPSCKAGDHSGHSFARTTKIPNGIRPQRLEGWVCWCHGGCGPTDG